MAKIEKGILGNFKVKLAILWDMCAEENNSSEANLKKDSRSLPYTQTHTSRLPPTFATLRWAQYFHSSKLVLKFVQELNHLLPLHDQVAEPVITDAVFELVGKFELTVPDARFKILKTNIGILF
jgi:hypothetical protein